MSYTPEQLREQARSELYVRHEREQFRAHADALEENARLTKRADDAHGAIKTLTQIVFEWKGRAERAEAELAKLRQHAEAMADAIERSIGYVNAAKAYRKDFPGDE